MFSILGDMDCITFYSESQEVKVKHMEIANGIIEKLKKDVEKTCNKQKLADKNTISVQVNVQGTEERVQNLMRYTVYIIDIEIMDQINRTFVRFSELKNLEKYVQSNFNLNQKLDNNSWFNNLE